jgi:hypothetical protein
MLIDLSQVPHGIRTKMDKILRDEYAAKSVQAQIRQRRAAKFLHDNRPRSIDGLGEQTMVLDPHIADNQSLARGVNWRQDEDYVRWYQKQNPETRVRSTGTKTQVGYTGKPEPAKRRLIKTYTWTP